MKEIGMKEIGWKEIGSRLKGDSAEKPHVSQNRYFQGLKNSLPNTEKLDSGHSG
jgi:hypothetical protein